MEHSFGYYKKMKYNEINMYHYYRVSMHCGSAFITGGSNTLFFRLLINDLHDVTRPTKGGLFTMYLYLSLALTICAAIGFGYGLFRFFRDQSALYVRMIIFAVGCAMLGRLFETLQLLVIGELYNGFHVGILGIIGSFLFLFSANFGQMDSIVDDGSSEFLKTRIISLAAPLVMVAIWCMIAIPKGLNESTISLGIETLFIALASYFHLKHLIIKDVAFGLIRSIRSYNLLSLIYAFLCMIEMVVESFNLPIVWIAIVYILQCAVLLAFVPVLERGVKKWTT